MHLLIDATAEVGYNTGILVDARNQDETESLFERYEILSSIKGDILKALEWMEMCFRSGGKLLTAGNGGSAADAEHIAGELMKGFAKKRPINDKLRRNLSAYKNDRGIYLAQHLENAYPVIPLVSQGALATAIANDIDPRLVFAQQLLGYGEARDIFLAISTSGNSENILYAAVLAHAMGIKVIALTGNDGGELGRMADIVIRVPEQDAYKVQELHLPIYHFWCRVLERRLGEECERTVIG